MSEGQPGAGQRLKLRIETESSFMNYSQTLLHSLNADLLALRHKMHLIVQ